MRFGKRNKTWSAVGRRLFGENDPNGQGSVAPETTFPGEVAAEQELEEQVMAIEESGVRPGGPMEPSQSLLISLGRFKRHIQRALGMPDNTHWPGECMRELVSMLQVALDNHWATLQTALTDTARVLSSYEHAGRAASCLPFLRASDDALSMMIGDLIIDNETPTVRDAWRKHYQTALETMRREGIPLIEDEQPAESPEEPVVEAAPDPPAEAPEVEAVEDSPAAAAAEPEPPQPAETPEAVSPFGEVAPVPPPLSGMPLPMPETPWDDVSPLEQSGQENLDSPGMSMATEGLSISVETQDPGTVAGNVEEAEPVTEEESCWEETAAPDGEDAVEASVAEEEPGELGMGLAEETVEPEPESVLEPEPVKPPTLEEINQAMQAAMLAGNVAEARVLAIQLAAALAQREADHVAAALEAARARLDLNREAMDEAERRVGEAEQRVRNAESQVAAREEEADAARGRISTLDGGIQEVQAEIEDLDGRIAALQRQRADAAQRLQEREAERADTIAAESLVRTEIESLMEEEEAGREFLDTARRRVRELAEARDTVESDILGLQRELERRKRAVGEISRPLGGEPEGDDGSAAGDMLF